MENNKKISLKEMAAASQFNKERDYWLNHLSGELVKSHFPLDFQQPVGQAPDSANKKMQTVCFRIDGDFFARLMKLRNGLDSTLHMVLVAGVVLLLEKYTGNNDIIVGTTILKQEKDANFLNTVLALRNRLVPHMTFKDLLLQVRQTILEAVAHQNYPLEKLLYQLDIPATPGSFPLFDMGIILQNIHERNYFGRIDLNMLFSFLRTQDCLEGTLEYHMGLYHHLSMQRLVEHFTCLLQQAVFNIDMELDRIHVMSSQELKQVLWDFNARETDYPFNRTVIDLFAGQVEKIPAHTAIIYRDKTLTFKQVAETARRLANYLHWELSVGPDDIVGIFMNNSPELIIAVFGILKSGGAYVPLDPSLPPERLRFIINDARIKTVLSMKSHIRDLNRLQWECPSFTTFLCLDSWDIYNEKEQERNELMDKKLWEYIGETAVDSITGGGWLTSYTGQPFSALEMEEYSHNILAKLTPLLHKDMRVLEIGCASGLSMFSLAPKVGFYYGTDLSDIIIEKDKEVIRAKGLENIRVACLPAHEIEKLDERDFDLVIMNSVIQSFHGHNYLRRVIGKVIGLMRENGFIFLGDVMDHEKKTALEQEMFFFRSANKGKGYKTKTDWSSELFVGRAFFHDIAVEFPRIKQVTVSDKIYTIENELTKFRYDVLLTVDKDINSNTNGPRHKNKYQEDMRALERENIPGWSPSAGENHLAYMIYTSGTTGKPRGVMINHRSLVNYLYWAIKQYTGPGEKATFPLYTTPSFDLTVTSIYLPLLTGNPLIIYDQNKQDKGHIPVLDVIGHNAVDMIKATPSHLNVLRYTYMNSAGNIGEELPPNNPIKRSGIRIFIVGGEELPAELARDIYRHFPGPVDIYNEYGPTEATVGCMIYKFKDVDNGRRGVPIGVPVDNVKIYLLDANLNPVPIGAAGEIYIGGDALARGYLNLAELTAKNFIKNPYLPSGTSGIFAGSRLYKTGDLACLLPGGVMEYIGRKDEQVKIRGYRVEIKDIENCLLGLAEIDKVIVIAQTDEGGDGSDGREMYLCAYYEAGEAIDDSEIRKYLAVELPDYMIPSYFMHVDRIPLTLNGKIDKKNLPGIKKLVSSRHKYIAPGNPLEEKLAAIWAGVLKLNKENISVDADFFELGGHSLRATIVVSNIHKELNIKVPLAEIFKTPTIRALAHYIKGKTQDKFMAIPAVEKMDYYALSPAQRRLYFLWQMTPGSAAYNEYSVLEMNGPVDKNRFEETFKKLIARHESFRTYFVRVGDDVRQRIAPEVHFQVDYVEVEGEGLETVMNRSIRPFDLEKPPLLRVKLIRFQAGRYWLIYDMHHIITDGTSMAVLLKEFAALYTGESLEPLRIQYKDFSQWQDSREGKDVLKKQESYWLQEFQAEIPVLQLYTDYPRPELQGFEGDRLRLVLGEEDTLILKAYALKYDVTLFMLLLGIYNVLLSHLSGQEDIVIGTPIAARRHADLQCIIGMFVNTLALRNYPVGDKRFIDFLGEIKTRTLEVFENQEYPFEELVEKVTVQRSMGRNPLFDTIFAVQNMESQVPGIPEARISDIQLKSPEFPRKIAKFDLSLHVLESGNVLTFILEYSTALFKKETVERFYRHFTRLALNAAAAPLKKIHDLDIIFDEEKECILYHFNDTAVDYPREKRIEQLFVEQAAKRPHWIAVIGGGAVETLRATSLHMTYFQLNEKSNQLAGLLIEKGVLADDIVAIKMPRSTEMVIAILATLKAGCAYMPIDPDYPQERIEYLLKDSNARILLTGDEKRKTNNCQCSIVNCQLSTRSTGLAYIIYTSGSTGKPKGVMVEHRSVVRLVINNDFIEFSDRLRVLQTGAPVFDAVTFEMWGPLLNGGQLYLVENEVILDPGKLSNVLQKYQINTMWLTASLCNQLVSRDSQENSIFSTLAWLVVGGDVLSSGPIAEIRRKNHNLTVVNGYGPTENTTFSVCHRIDRDDEYNIPIGKPITNSTAYIFDKYNRLQPIGVPGELVVGGDGLARGYLNNSELTAEKFKKHRSYRSNRTNIFYRTGDLGRWLPNGLIEFLGRIDNQVKIRGFRVELGEIEKCLAHHPEIDEVVVTVLNRDDQNRDKLLCAYYTATRQLVVDELRNYLEQELPGYMIPSYFMQLETMPLTRNGKIDRRALPMPQFQASHSYTPPNDEIEAQIIEIWSRVLGLKKEIIGIHDDFFHLGGHSLKAMLLTLQIAKVFNVAFTLTDVFTGPTVKEMADLVRCDRKNYYEEIKPIEKREYYLQASPQKRLFFLEQFENIGTTYNIPSVLKITGKLDIQKFYQAIKKVIQRHDTLRTSFKIIANEPVQVIHDRVEFEIENYTAGPGTSPDDCIREFVRPFDLSRAPLLRIGLIALPLPAGENETKCESKNESENYLLMYDLHHIIGDGTSMGILIDDFAAFYDGRKLPSLHVQYKDFTDWQNHMIAAGEFQKQEEYWLKVFEKEIPLLNFPTDYPRPENLSFKGDRYSFKLEGEDAESIYAMAVENKATLFMVMLAAFNALLYKYSGQDDIIVGTGIMGRHHADLLRSIGMFVNSLAIRNYPAGEKTFRRFLSEVRENCIGAFANQDIQFEELVDKLKLQRDNSRNPLFDVLLVVQNFQQAQLADSHESELVDLKISSYAHENKTAKFDLNLAVFESGESEKEIHFRLEYAADLFKPETITEIADNYLGILKQIIKKWDILLDDLMISNDLLEVKPGISSIDKSEFTF